jgi:hypothetical protein
MSDITTHLPGLLGRATRPARYIRDLHGLHQMKRLGATIGHDRKRLSDDEGHAAARWPG